MTTCMGMNSLNICAQFRQVGYYRSLIGSPLSQLPFYFEVLYRVADALSCHGQK